jgi:hypothetical protein
MSTNSRIVVRLRYQNFLTSHNEFSIGNGKFLLVFLLPADLDHGRDASFKILGERRPGRGHRPESSQSDHPGHYGAPLLINAPWSSV